MRVSQSDIDKLVNRINEAMGVSLTDRPVGGNWVIGSYIVDYCGLHKISNVSGATRAIVEWGTSCPRATQRMVLIAFLQGISAARAAVEA